MISVIINDEEFLVEASPDLSILQLCNSLGVLIPRFCYHDLLSVAGNCRMCLVEIEGIEKPVVSCLTPVTDKAVIYTDSLLARKARESVLEILLVNHPLDCPICDQAGECDLQDQTQGFGKMYSKHFFNKRSVEDKDCGPLIKTIMTRCIYCTRCVRFSSEIAGVEFLATFNRGSGTEIGAYAGNLFDSEISGNVIDLCPVGALTSKPFAYQVRPWELIEHKSIDVEDSVGSNIYAYTKHRKILRVLPRENEFINGGIITDIARFSYDSHTNNRERNISENNKGNLVQRGWNFFSRFWQSEQKTFSSLFLMNEDCGLNPLAMAKKISGTCDDVFVCSPNGKAESNNLYLWNTDKIKEINVCGTFGMIIGTNPKVEGSTFNVVLRKNFLTTLLNMIVSNPFHGTNYPQKFMSFELKNTLSIGEGKSGFYGSLMNFAQFPLFVLGEASLQNHGLNLFSIVTFFSSYFETLKSIKLNKTANSEGLSFLNIRNISKTVINRVKNVFLINLENTLALRKLMFQKIKIGFLNNQTPMLLKLNFYWFNTHQFDDKKTLESAFNNTRNGAQLKAKIPLLSRYEEEQIFMNLEGRSQKTNRIFNKFGLARTLSKIFFVMFPILEKFMFVSNSRIAYKMISENAFSYLNFLNEITTNQNLYDDLNKYYSNTVYLNYNENEQYSSFENNIIMNTPMKPTVDVNSLYNRYLKNSFILRENTKYIEQKKY